MIAQIILYIAIFLNCWIMGRVISFDGTEHDIYSLLLLAALIASINTVIFTGILLTTLK